MILIESDSETTEWFPTAMSWKSSDERHEWAHLCARAVLYAHEERPKRRALKALSERLAMFVEGFSNVTADQGFLFIPDPSRLPVPAFTVMGKCEGDRDTKLREIVQADAKSAVRPVEVDTFTTERFGEGLRSTRYWATADGALMMTVRFGWRLEKAGIDLCLFVFCNDPGWLATHLDEIDDFARSLWVNEIP